MTTKTIKFKKGEWVYPGNEKGNKPVGYIFNKDVTLTINEEAE